MLEARKDAIFHVHTYRCKHMRDDKKEEAYIKKAMELGGEEIWFCDHAPFPDGKFNFRMNMDELSDYVKTLQELKSKYVGSIDVKIGLEIEYIATYLEYYKKLHDSGNFDVFLLGQHFTLLSDGSYTFEFSEKTGGDRALADAMIQGMETGLFQVVAHPDQIFRRNKEWNKATEIIAREIKACAICTGVIMEQNISNLKGKKKKYAYRPEFWENFNGPTIYGVDAHSVEELEENYNIQLELIEGEIR